MVASIAPRILLLLPLSLIIYGICNRYLSPLRRYPGPFLASCTRLWNIARVLGWKYNEEQVKLHARYGPIVRIAPDVLSIASPGMAEAIFAPGRGFYKSAWYTVFPPQEPKDIFTELDEKLHARKKRVAGVPYSMKSMLSTVHATDKTIATLIRQLDRIASQSDTIDLGEWIHYFTFDYVGEVVFGRTFGFLEAGSDIEDCIHTIGQGGFYLVAVAQVPWLDAVIRSPIWSYLPWTQRKDLFVADKALTEVKARMAFGSYQKSRRNDILDQLIEGHLKDPDRLGAESIGAVAIGAM